MKRAEGSFASFRMTTFGRLRKPLLVVLLSLLSLPSCGGGLGNHTTDDCPGSNDYSFFAEPQVNYIPQFLCQRDRYTGAVSASTQIEARGYDYTGGTLQRIFDAATTDAVTDVSWRYASSTTWFSAEQDIGNDGTADTVHRSFFNGGNLSRYERQEAGLHTSLWTYAGGRPVSEASDFESDGTADVASAWTWNVDGSARAIVTWSDGATAEIRLSALDASSGTYQIAVTYPSGLTVATREITAGVDAQGRPNQWMIRNPADATAETELTWSYGGDGGLTSWARASGGVTAETRWESLDGEFRESRYANGATELESALYDFYAYEMTACEP